MSIPVWHCDIIATMICWMFACQVSPIVYLVVDHPNCVARLLLRLFIVFAAVMKLTEMILAIKCRARARTCSRPDVSSSQVQKLITIKSEVRSKVSTSPRVMTRLLPGLYSICNAEHVDRRIINRWTLICTPTLASTNIDNTPACRHAPRSPSVQGVALLTFQCVSRYGCYYDTGRDSSIVQCLLIGEIGT